MAKNKGMRIKGKLTYKNEFSAVIQNNYQNQLTCDLMHTLDSDDVFSPYSCPAVKKENKNKNILIWIRPLRQL